MAEINGRPTAPADRGNNSNRSVGGSIASALFNSAKSYVTNIGRSVRDVPTAFGTALDTRGAIARGESYAKSFPGATPSDVKEMSRHPIKNLGEQIGQAITSVVPGIQDSSRSSQYKGPNKEYIYSPPNGLPVPPKLPKKSGR